MSYQGIRVDLEGKVFVRYRARGVNYEVGPYDTSAQAIKENIGRELPPANASVKINSVEMTSTQSRSMSDESDTSEDDRVASQAHDQAGESEVAPHEERATDSE